MSDDAVVIAEVARAFPSPVDVAGPWSTQSPTQRVLKSGLQRESDLNISDHYFFEPNKTGQNSTVTR